MALDAITGRPFTPKFKGQRTGQKIDFDPAAWQEQWNLGEAGDVGSIEAGAIQSIKDALAQRHAGNQFYSATSQDISDHWAAENAANMGTPGYQEYIPTQAELARTGDVRLQDEASRIFREQMMGGYNPNIDYRAEGVTPNVFLRSGEGLGGWEGMGRPTVEQPGGVPLGYGVPEMPSAPQPAAVQVSTPQPAAVPAAAPAAAPAASTRRTTSAGAAAGPAPTTEETAADAIANVQTTLDKQNKAIQQAVVSGLIDIGAAGTIWDNQRKQIYKDFVDQYGGAGDQYATEEDRITGQRKAERTKILADLDMRGVDASMVGEELSILDALVASQANANVDYTNEIGDIAGMANVDRKWLGEGIFGNYKQDLRSGARDLMLGAGLNAATAEGTRLDQALAANTLADRFGESPSTLMGGFVGGVDLPTMSWQTGERLGSQDWQTIEKDLDRQFTTSEREAIELFRTSERESSQTWQTGERTGTQTWQSDEALLGRTWQTDERIGAEGWQTLERDLDRTFTTEEREAVEVFRTSEREASETWQGGQAVDQRTWAGGESALDRLAQGIDPLTGQPYGFDPLSGLTGAQTIGQQNFMLGLAGQGIDTRQTITQGTPWGPMQVANPNYGRPIGFDEQTGLTAGQTQDQTNWQAAFDQSGGQFEAGQLAQGIDTRQTITRPNYLTGAMETVVNPAYGRPMGFDAASGLTAGQQGDQAYRDAMLAADETAATQAQTNWQSTYDAGMMGVDTREYVPGPETDAEGLALAPHEIRNPTYGMTPSQQADYTLDLTALTQVGATETDTFDNLMRYLGQTGDATLTSEVLGKVAEIIATDPGMMTKGPNADTTLYALGVLANTEVENAEGEITFPYRDIFFAVQNLGDGTNQQSTAGGGTAGGGTAGGGTAGGGTAGGAVDTLDVGPAGYGTGAGNLSESEIMNQDLVDLIVEGQAGFGPGFEYGTGVSGAAGDAAAAAGKGAAGAAQDVWGAMQGDSYTSSSGTEYGSTQLEQIANSAIPPSYTVQQWINFMEERGKKWGLKSDGRFGWE